MTAREAARPLVLGRLRVPAAVLDVLAVAVPALPIAFPLATGNASWRWLALDAALLLPLLWRRRAPMAVFCVIAAVALLQWCVTQREVTSDASLLVALYTVAAQCDIRRSVFAAAVVEGGIVLVAASATSSRQATGFLIGMTAMAATAAVLGTNARTRRAYLASVEDRAVRLERERDQLAQLAVAEERARIAREIHDVVSHSVSVMVALADAAVLAQHTAPERTGEAMRQVAHTGRQALTDMRRSLGVLRTDEPDALRHPMPGIAELGLLAEQVRATGLPTDVAVLGDPGVVPAGAQLTVHRLVQEALTNTLRHAAPGARATVRVRCDAAAVDLEVTDDGRPPAHTAPGPAGTGHGLSGMRERVAAYAGSFTAGPLPGGTGWRVAARLELGGAA
ncbi:sensor histidine kinase [Yinghuangia soli]|uniref:histidine kinase n=1 Tax=Yinghuangia soli TaxID=2908204 RepID=A0AA41Q318_9ACTN|nr:histidine kinase [Yinghuangia soli]MCF2529182.1 histidine kinase [Yinghuangia soli]